METGFIYISGYGLFVVALVILALAMRKSDFAQLAKKLSEIFNKLL